MRVVHTPAQPASLRELGIGGNEMRRLRAPGYVAECLSSTPGWSVLCRDTERRGQGQRDRGGISHFLCFLATFFAGLWRAFATFDRAEGLWLSVKGLRRRGPSFSSPPMAMAVILPQVSHEPQTRARNFVCRIYGDLRR